MKREVATRRVARDDDAGRGRALIQQVTDSSSRLAQLGREGVFGREGYFKTMNEKSPRSCLEIERTVVEKGDPDGTLELFLEGPKHLEDLGPDRKNIPSALAYNIYPARRVPDQRTAK